MSACERCERTDAFLEQVRRDQGAREERYQATVRLLAVARRSEALVRAERDAARAQLRTLRGEQ